MATPSSLPTSRQLLTSLVDSLSAIPAPSHVRHDPIRPRTAPIPAASSSRSLQPKAASAAAAQRLPPSARPYLLTLHLLFPSLLLPALDLLDRRCVSRLVLRGGSGSCGGGGDEGGGGGVGDGRVSDDAPALQDGRAATTGEGKEKRQRPHVIYTVRSSATSSASSTGRSGGRWRRQRRAGGAAEEADGDAETAPASVPVRRSYVVHVAAWNCSCAAFAFAAFPASGASLSATGAGAGSVAGASGAMDQEGNGGDDGRGDEQCPLPWEGFGGLSLQDAPSTAQPSPAPPCCKHLLACVLAERWPDMLGDFVAEKAVGVEEAAGWVAGE